MSPAVAKPPRAAHLLELCTGEKSVAAWQDTLLLQLTATESRALRSVAGQRLRGP